MLTQHDAEDPDNLVHLGQTDQGEDVEINKRAATTNFLVYVNINLVSMDGGHKSVATGLASYRSLRHHHDPDDAPLKSFIDQPSSELHSSNWRMGRLMQSPGSRSSKLRRRSTTTRSHRTSSSSRSGNGNGAP